MSRCKKSSSIRSLYTIASERAKGLSFLWQNVLCTLLFGAFWDILKATEREKNMNEIRLEGE